MSALLGLLLRSPRLSAGAAGLLSAGLVAWLALALLRLAASEAEAARLAEAAASLDARVRAAGVALAERDLALSDLEVANRGLALAAAGDAARRDAVIDTLTKERDAALASRRRTARLLDITEDRNEDLQRALGRPLPGRLLDGLCDAQSRAGRDCRYDADARAPRPADPPLPDRPRRGDDP